MNCFKDLDEDMKRIGEEYKGVENHDTLTQALGVQLELGDYFYYVGPTEPDAQLAKVYPVKEPVVDIMAEVRRACK